MVWTLNDKTEQKPQRSYHAFISMNANGAHNNVIRFTTALVRNMRLCNGKSRGRGWLKREADAREICVAGGGQLEQLSRIDEARYESMMVKKGG